MAKHLDKLTTSQESYIKAIYKIVNDNKVARVKDISKLLGIGPSSVSEALKLLAEKQLINYVPYGLITLSQEGQLIAEELDRNYSIVKNYLLNILMIDEKSSEKNANTIIHNLSEDVLERFVRFLEFTQICPCKEPKWMRGFQDYIKAGIVSDKCQQCMNYCKDKGITKPINAGNSEKCCGID